MVATELQSLATSNHTPSKQLCIIATNLLAVNLAFITGVSNPSSELKPEINDFAQRKSRIAQSEKLYGDLISVCYI